jgi:hypothetical protein
MGNGTSERWYIAERRAALIFEARLELRIRSQVKLLVSIKPKLPP